MRTPKETAEELFYKISYNSFDEDHHCSHYVAKNCSLIAVDEILNLVNDIWMDSFTTGKSDNKFWNYWNEVKSEIENL